MESSAFSLLGPNEGWMTVDIGYQLGGDIGGPLNLGEEYRWNTPVIVYGYDASFLDWFGQKGVDAIEQAIKIINALPSVSSFSADLHEFPLDTRRENYRAAALNLIDLKSEALALLMEQLGLAGAERWAWTLRSRVVINNIPFYTTTMRNFDPITLRPSPFVNGTLYTYQILQTYANPDTWEAVDQPVDPLAPSASSVAIRLAIPQGTIDFRGTADTLSPGIFYTGLTRDDVGGLRYIYSRKNLNLENLATNAISGFGGGGGGGSPWTPVSGGGATNVTASSNLVVTAVRPGIDKLTLRRADFDSLLGSFFTNVVSYNDVFISNSVPSQQQVQRVLTAPDIVFSAGDVGVNAAGIPLLLVRNGGFPLTGGTPVAGAGGGVTGPGTMNGPVRITFSKVRPFFRNVGDGGTEESSSPGSFWGSYDGSTNAPIVFPDGTSIEELERAVLGSGSSNPWRLP